MGIGREDDELPLAVELPDEVDPRVRKLPLHRQEVWLQAYDDAIAELGNRRQAEAVAWAEATTTREEDEDEEPRHLHPPK